MHKSLDEFEFRPNPTTNYGVSCPWVSKKSTSTFSPLLLIRSFSNLQVMRTCTFWMSSNFYDNAYRLESIQYGNWKEYAQDTFYGKIREDKISLNFSWIAHHLHVIWYTSWQNIPEFFLDCTLFTSHMICWQNIAEFFFNCTLSTSHMICWQNMPEFFSSPEPKAHKVSL